jgi:hypothetical protein|uniref:hypothetical protein n=2 Tax=Yoonia sp. TaxID=2212373 RepID=UPI004048B89E|tara:strand:- start:87 stop:299 length:213 start_codon:yes stop_codon:yes gene_type:complete
MWLDNIISSKRITQLGISMVFISSFVGIVAAAIAVVFAGFGPIGGLGIYTLVGASLFMGWIAELMYFENI